MMSKAVSPQHAQSTTRAAETVHVPLLSTGSDPLFPLATDALTGHTDPRFLHARFVQQVLTAAGEVESAEWTLDQVLQDAASCDEIGVGLDVEPVDGALESARWALDQAVDALHAEIRRAARHGVPACELADAALMDVAEVQRLVADPAHAAPACEGALRGDLAAAV